MMSSVNMHVRIDDLIVVTATSCRPCVHNWENLGWWAHMSCLVLISPYSGTLTICKDAMGIGCAECKMTALWKASTSSTNATWACQFVEEIESDTFAIQHYEYT